MLESRIEKLRSLESKVKANTVCSKSNCPVSLDPRTTDERFGNESALQLEKEQGPGKEMHDRIERFRQSQVVSK